MPKLGTTNSSAMPSLHNGHVVGQAPGKVILTGEHAVVYGYPAVALPLFNLRAQATFVSASPGYGTVIAALDLLQHARLTDPSPLLKPLVLAAKTAIAEMGLENEPNCILQVRSQIPVARGLGSGAAVVCALVRAMSKAAKRPLDLNAQNRIVLKSEKLLHVRPSGIDNLTIVHGQPLFFRKGQQPVFFHARQCPVFLLADTGVSVPTSKAVARVAELRMRNPRQAEGWFEEIGEISKAMFEALKQSKPAELGPLLNSNQELLRRLGVSSVANEKLIQAALMAGSPAAKVTGAGLGGQILAIAHKEDCRAMDEALRAAGATEVRQVQWQAPAPACKD